MEKICELYQTADWKTEKHVPALEVPAVAKKGELVRLLATVGKDKSHPSTTEHHIEWVEMYFHPSGEKYPFMIGRLEFRAHGASVLGANTSTIYTEPVASCSMRAGKSGTVMAVSSCNVHGLWASSAELKVE